MSHLTALTDHLSEMQRISKSLQEHESQLNDILANGKRLGYTKVEIGAMVANCKDVIKTLVSEYRTHSKAQFEALRMFEVQDRKPIQYITQPMRIAHDSGMSDSDRNDSLHKAY